MLEVCSGLRRGSLLGKNPGYGPLCVNQTCKEWQEMQRQRQGDLNLASVHYQFLIKTFGRVHDTQRWYVYPDAGYFSREKLLDSVEIRLIIT
jgi:hypothetical protein